MPSFRRALYAFRTATVLTGRPAWAAGVRASLATVIPLAAGQLLDHQGAATWMSLGGFNGALSDKGGSYSSRAWTMAALMGTSAIAAALATVVSGHLALVLAATFAVAFFTSVLRVWGNPGISVGSATLTVYVVALAIPTAAAAEAFARAGYLVLGGLWAMGIALVLWPLRPYRPARLAVSAVYTALANYQEQLAIESRMRDTTEWPVFTPAHSTSVRTALENANAILVQLRRGRPGAADRGERLLVLAESADQTFGHSVALGDTLASLRTTGRNDSLHERCIELLRAMATTSRQVAAAIESESATVPIAVPWGGEQLRHAMRLQPPADVNAQYEHAAMIADRASQFASAAAVTVEELNGGQPDAADLAAAVLVRAPASEEPPEEHALWQSFRAMLSPGSLIVRFALRVAVVTTIAVALAELLELKRGYWLTITVIVILQPYTGVTFTRALQRVLGTVLGALLAAGLGIFFHDARAVLVIATVFVACCVALLPLNYAAFSVFLTPTFVLLAEASAGDWHLAGTRVVNTLLGGALALAGARFLWPSPEQSRFPAYAAATLHASAEYLECVVALYHDPRPEAGETMRARRRALGLTMMNAEESLQRALNEAHGDQQALAPALTLLAYARRFAASVAALAITRHAAHAGVRRAIEPFSLQAASTLGDLAGALEEGRVPLPLSGATVETPPLPAVVTARIERLSRQITTLHDSVARLVAASQRTEPAGGGTVLAPIIGV